MMVGGTEGGDGDKHVVKDLWPELEMFKISGKIIKKGTWVISCVEEKIGEQGKLVREWREGGR